MTVDLPTAVPRPCSDCPWRRVATAGWLGPHDAETWVAIAHGEVAIACHQTIRDGDPDSDGEDAWNEPGVRQCAGAAIYRTNVCKLPKRRDVARAETADRDTVFAGPGEFIAHHSRVPTS